MVSELNIQIENKDSEIQTLTERIEELESQLSEVETFDSQVLTTSNYISYTGDAIETQIEGDFEGWDGETIFQMTNGMIWQQSSYDYRYHYAYRPDVLIYSKSGTYYMRVEDVNDEIEVVRIK
nr:hypothetical protein [uncultured Flavobacterium sp.]